MATPVISHKKTQKKEEAAMDGDVLNYSNAVKHMQAHHVYAE